MMGGTGDFSELRIAMLGNVECGKSSAGNTILGREEFQLKRTAQCVKREREVGGRQITVVEAPGWWTDTPVKESAELLKQELVLSVSQCPPGPHALLLVVRLYTIFKEDEIRVLTAHMKLLGERVWSHTVVLFTFGDLLGDTPIEQHIESEGKALQWLVETCGNRYHVLDNKNRGNDTQVTELLEKIEKMVAANGGHHFEMDRKILQEVEEKRRAEEERAKERMVKLQKQREALRSIIRSTSYLSKLRIVLLGCRYAGKSLSGNTILGKEKFELLRSAQCVKQQRKVAGRHITVVEAPGWSNRTEKNSELLKQEIMLSMTLCPPGPHCLLLVIRVDIGFKANEANILNGYMKLFSHRAWSQTLVLFTFGDYLGDTPIEQHIESEGKALQWLVEKCRNRYHVLNNEYRGDGSQVTELLGKIEEMVAANSGRHFNIDKRILQQVDEARRAVKAREKEKMKVEKKIFPVTEKKKSSSKMSSSTDSYPSSGYGSIPSVIVPGIHKVKKCVSSELATSEISETLGTELKTLAITDSQVPEVFSPDRLAVENSLSYRFLCCHAGQFQCKVTSLVFEMEGKGEVLYKIDTWDTRLSDGLGQMQPAGPLYNIECFAGSLSHLHLPHCEISSGKNQVELTVAHVTGENIEVIKPLKVTSTHVIIRVHGLSLFVLLKKMIFYESHIRAQILLFYKEIKQSKKKLLMHLLPSNVPVEEVEKKQRNSIYFETSSMCQLIPGRKYKPSCDPFTPQPKVAIFEREYGPNYHPTFVVFFETQNVTVSLLYEDGTEVWEPHEIFVPANNSDASLPKQKRGAEFVEKHRETLIQRVCSVMEIVDTLQSRKMIRDEMYNNIKAAKTSQDKMRILYEVLQSEGMAVKDEFFQTLKLKHPFLVDELGSSKD